MTITIELSMICPDCEKVGTTSGHGTTVEQCEWSLERACAWPHEHHVSRRRRPRVRVRMVR